MKDQETFGSKEDAFANAKKRSENNVELAYIVVMTQAWEVWELKMEEEIPPYCIALFINGGKVMLT